MKRSRISKKKASRPARRAKKETPATDVIEIDISDTPELVGLLGYEPRLFEGNESLKLLCRPNSEPRPPVQSAERVFFQAIARARDHAKSKRRTK